MFQKKSLLILDLKTKKSFKILFFFFTERDKKCTIFQRKGTYPQMFSCEKPVLRNYKREIVSIFNVLKQKISSISFSCADILPILSTLKLPGYLSQL